MSRLIQPYSMPDLALAGHSRETAFVVPGWGLLRLQDAMAVNWSLRQPSVRYDPWIEIDMTLRATNAQFCPDVPKDLRLADDMTIRELLSVVHRKIGGT
jgi:hypothetical protein